MTNAIIELAKAGAEAGINAASDNPWAIAGMFVGAALFGFVEAWRRKRKARKK